MGTKRKSLFSSSQGVVRQEEKRDWQMAQCESGLLREPSCSPVSLSWLVLHCSASLGPHWVIAPSRGSPKRISILLLQIGTSEDQPSIVQAQRMAQPPGFLKITREHLLSGSPRLHPNLKKKKKEGGGKAFKQNSWKWALVATHRGKQESNRRSEIDGFLCRVPR